MKISSAIQFLLIYLVLNFTAIIWALILEIWLLTLFLVVSMVFGTRLLIKLGLAAFTGDFENNVDLSGVELKWVTIPQNNGEPDLYGAFYCARGSSGIKKPLIIAAHGANNILEMMEWFTVPLALNGFHVLAFNQSGHGRSPHKSPGNGKSYPIVMMNIHPVVDFAMKLPCVAVDPSGVPKIGFVGHSTGGLMALTQAYLNPHIQCIVAMSQVHDFMALVDQNNPLFSEKWWFKFTLKLSGMKIDFNEAENKIISPAYCLRPDPANANRVYLIHCHDDVLPFEDALKNKEFAQIPDENCLFPETGGHGFRAQETIVVAIILRWFTQKFLKA
jgi:pimeloyl-ACP methyl ester carboxylesterase